MSAMLMNMLVAAFNMNTFFNNAKTKGAQWSLEFIVAVGGVGIIFAAVEFVKAIKARDGGGGHWFKFFAGIAVGGTLIWSASGALKSLSGGDTFSSLTGVHETILNALPYLPLHDLARLII